jgi:Rrf2 family protein
VKLSTKTRYGVRAVFDIAYHNSGRPTQARDIARRQDVPLRYLEQIFQELRRANLVDAKRGPKGGYFLSRAPEAITLGDVIRAAENGIPTSRQVPADIWRELAQKISGVFDSVSIRDLCQRGEKLGINRGEGQPPMYFI